MMSLIAGRAGTKFLSIVALVLAVGLISYFVTQYIQEAEKDKITVEIQEETNERRKVIRDAIKETPRPTARSGGAPSGDASDSLRYLRERQGR